MRRVIIRFREEEERKLRQTLEKLSYPVISKENTIEIYVPDEKIEEFLSQIENTLDMRYKENIIVVDKPDIILGGPIKRLEPEPVGETPVDELLEMAKKNSKVSTEKVILTVFAGYIAVIGLVLGNPPIVIGAMLLSPLLSPLYAFSLNVFYGKKEYIRQSINSILLLVGSVYFFTLLISTLLYFGLNINPVNNEILNRTVTHDPLYSFLAILLGFATILSTRIDVTEAIAGIAIAAALIPPLVASSLLLPISLILSMRALSIVLQNIFGLILGSMIAIRILNIKPRRRNNFNRKTTLITFILSSLIIIALSIIDQYFLK